MSAVAQRRGAASPLDVLSLRAEALAYLVSIGEVQLTDSVDRLQFDAERTGVVDAIGQDAVQQLLADVFQAGGNVAEWAGRGGDATASGDAPAGFWSEEAIIARWEAADSGGQYGPPTAKPYPTPQTTVEAILYCVRERGLAALNEPANQERLSRCDAAALAEIDRRMGRLARAS